MKTIAMAANGSGAAVQNNSSISPADAGNSGMNGRGGQQYLPGRWRWPSFLGGWKGDRSEPRSGNGARTDEDGGSENGVESGFIENGSAFASSDPFVESSGRKGTGDNNKAVLNDQGSPS